MSDDTVLNILVALLAAWLLGAVNVWLDAWESGLIVDRPTGVAWVAMALYWPAWRVGRLVDRIRGRRP